MKSAGLPASKFYHFQEVGKRLHSGSCKILCFTISWNASLKKIRGNLPSI